MGALDLSRGRLTAGHLYYVDAVQHLSNARRPATVAVLRTRNLGENVFRGATRQPVEIHPRLQAALDRVRVRSRTHGRCAEIEAINRALTREGGAARLEDSVIKTRKVRKPGHPHHLAPHAPCETCRDVLHEFGIKYLG